MAAPEEGVVAFSLAELLFPVGAITTRDGATGSGAVLNVANRTVRQSMCRLLCQMNAVAMTTTMTHMATPTATVTSRWSVQVSSVDVRSASFSSPTSVRLDLSTSSTQKHNNDKYCNVNV